MVGKVIDDKLKDIMSGNEEKEALKGLMIGALKELSDKPPHIKAASVSGNSGQEFLNRILKNAKGG